VWEKEEFEEARRTRKSVGQDQFLITKNDIIFQRVLVIPKNLKYFRRFFTCSPLQVKMREISKSTGTSSKVTGFDRSTGGIGGAWVRQPHLDLPPALDHPPPSPWVSASVLVRRLPEGLSPLPSPSHNNGGASPAAVQSGTPMGVPSPLSFQYLIKI